MNLTPIQVVNLMIYGGILGIAIGWMIKAKSPRRWYMLGVVTWSVHACVFYAFVAIYGQVFTEWSAILRLHGGLTVLSSLIAMALSPSSFRMNS